MASVPAHSNARAVLRPLGLYAREAGGRDRLSSQVTSLLALHRVAWDTALSDAVWLRSGTALCRSLLERLRASSASSRS